MIAYLDLTQKHSSNTPKLIGYRTGTQDRSGIVPGGFITWLVWEIVPGLRLGYRNGAGPFWVLESYKKEQVRAELNQALPQAEAENFPSFLPLSNHYRRSSKLVENGWYPNVRLC